MATNKVTTIKISANLPIMFINKYGVGVNGVAADSSNSLKVKGNANIAGTLNATNVQVGSNNVYHTGRKPTPADIGASPTSHNHFNCGIIDAKDLNNYTTEGLQGVTNNNCTNQPASGYFYIFNMKYNNTNIKQIAYGYNQQKMYTRHRYNGTWSGWQKVYTSDNKPTPTEIGAIPEANREIRFLGNVKSGTVIFDKTKLKNGVKVSFMTSNKMGTDSWHYAINGKWTDGWTMSQEAKYVFDFTKIKSDGSVWLYEVSVFNTYRESIGSRRCDGASKLYIGELNTLMVYLDHATNVCDNLTALIEYY